MQGDNDSSASGYIVDSFEGICQEFTDVEILNTSDANIVARAKRYGRWWLLKGLNKSVADEAAYQQRLRKEFELLMQLQHQLVVAAVELESVDGIGSCIVMEWIEGQTLEKWLQADRPRRERRRIVKEIVEAVGYIHSKGIVHRDLKPENIIITANGNNVKLIDFGLADTDSHTILKQPAGTRKYISPEQMLTSVADVRNDIYSLGVIFSRIKPGYGSIADRCQLSIERRYQNASELMDAIKKCERRNVIFAWSIVSLVILALAITVYAQSVRVKELSQQVNSNHQEQADIQATVSSLNDSLGKVTTAHQKLMQNQQVQEAKRKRVEDAITGGKNAIDKALQESGVKQHLDTLNDIAYLRMDIFNRMYDGGKAYNAYLKAIRHGYSENEMAEITNALVVYDGNKIKDLINRYTKLKENHDKAFMRGN